MLASSPGFQFSEHDYAEDLANGDAPLPQEEAYE